MNTMLRGVPAVTLWSGESRTGEIVLQHSGASAFRPARVLGVGYADERGADRDAMGVLIQRRLQAPGWGTARLKLVHPARQYRFMAGELCQGCGGDPDRTAAGTLWLMPRPDAAPLGWPEGARVEHPPICLPCALRSRGACPEGRRRGWVSVRVGDSELSHVAGPVFSERDGRPVEVGQGVLSYDDPGLGWITATRWLRTLWDCTPVDLDAEARDAADTRRMATPTQAAR
ncbi:hypothetical protein PUR61_02045 [Streptomyces sp. BE20]|uniref:hypothetical protein n=1 Tax=Streptomyces sp. BE20 TaxID=3002525 RepID=UPI002E78238E|nr:hypothetical protein [Streptomyces sp. BE20]MEE1820988.1 hypothetical protein [Streptomyces sp. BE20]